MGRLVVVFNHLLNRAASKNKFPSVFVRDDGIASCLELKTDEPHWQERIYSANVKVSPVAGDGKICFMNGQANCVVVKASSKLEILATNEFNGSTLSTPAISGGQLFLRTDGHLYCIAKN